MNKEQEDNKLIAEFIGTCKQDSVTGDWYFNENNPPTKHASYVWSSLLYHESWDWQIPVWRKINLAIKDIIDKIKNKQTGLGVAGTEISYLRNMCKDYRNAVFQNNPGKGKKIIADGIKWYNQNK